MTFVRRRLLAGRAVEETGTWDCGYARPTAAHAVHGLVLCPAAHGALSPGPADARPFGCARRASSRGAPLSRRKRPDVFGEAVFRPAFSGIARALDRLRVLQHGRIQLYVLYIVADAGRSDGLEARDESHGVGRGDSFVWRACSWRRSCSRFINRTKAFFAGRRGQPLLQPYFDLVKLLRKGATYSRTTTWVFRAGPIVGLAARAGRPGHDADGRAPGARPFPGRPVALCVSARADAILSPSSRRWTRARASRAWGRAARSFFSALAEPALLLGLAARGHRRRGASRCRRCSGRSRRGPGRPRARPSAWSSQRSAWSLLTENARIPVDDPTTHLELTMIHEVMVLDHGGPDLAFILYGAALKLWILGALLVGLAVPVRTRPPRRGCRVVPGRDVPLGGCDRRRGVLDGAAPAAPRSQASGGGHRAGRGGRRARFEVGL